VAKLLISSILIVPLLIGHLAARNRSSRRGFRRAILAAVAFNAFYALCLVYLYFKLA
jgi:hypothetical protein